MNNYIHGLTGKIQTAQQIYGLINIYVYKIHFIHDA